VAGCARLRSHAFGSPPRGLRTSRILDPTIPVVWLHGFAAFVFSSRFHAAFCYAPGCTRTLRLRYTPRTGFTRTAPWHTAPLFAVLDTALTRRFLDVYTVHLPHTVHKHAALVRLHFTWFTVGLSSCLHLPHCRFTWLCHTTHTLQCNTFTAVMDGFISFTIHHVLTLRLPRFGSYTSLPRLFMVLVSGLRLRSSHLATRTSLVLRCACHTVTLTHHTALVLTLQRLSHAYITTFGEFSSHTQFSTHLKSLPLRTSFSNTSGYALLRGYRLSWFTHFLVFVACVCRFGLPLLRP